MENQKAENGSFQNLLLRSHSRHFRVALSNHSHSSLCRAALFYWVPFHVIRNVLLHLGSFPHSESAGTRHQWVGRELFRFFPSSSIHTPSLLSLGAITRHLRGSVGMFSYPTVRPRPRWLVLKSGKTEGKRKCEGHIRGPGFLISGPSEHDCSEERLIKSILNLCGENV